MLLVLWFLLAESRIRFLPTDFFVRTFFHLIFIWKFKILLLNNCFVIIITKPSIQHAKLMIQNGLRVVGEVTEIDIASYVNHVSIHSPSNGQAICPKFYITIWLRSVIRANVKK